MAIRLYFDANEHEYTDADTGRVLPSITQMLDRCGWIDDRWYTEASCERGTQVHQLTADYDLGAIENPESVVSKYKGYLLAYVKMTQILRPEWRSVEEPRAHPSLGFAGRADRLGMVYGAHALGEVKSGGYEEAHPIQMALQAILVAPEVRLPPEAIERYGVYVKENGKFKVERFVSRRDFDEAAKIIRRCCQ